MAVRASIHGYGGYDYKFVRQVPERFMCVNICTKVLREPHLTVCCGQHFCGSCLTHWFKRQGKKSCPHCRAKGFNHFLNKALKREIDELNIHCTHYKEGCQWIGELGNLQTHFDKVCSYVKVECPNKCSKIRKFQRQALQDHLDNECFKRRYKCKYCGHEDTYRNITGKGYHSTLRRCHYDTCPEYPRKCPNICGARTIKRKDMSTHRDKCPEELIKCPNKCRTWPFNVRELKRKDLPYHLSNRCYLRRYKCEHCGFEDTYEEITGIGDNKRQRMKCHYDTCPEYPFKCPIRCGARAIKRKDMFTHRDRCPLEPVECPFEADGCTTRVVRKDFDNHMSTQVHHHMLLMKTKHDHDMQEMKMKHDRDMQEMKMKFDRDLQEMKTKHDRHMPEIKMAHGKDINNKYYNAMGWF